MIKKVPHNILIKMTRTVSWQPESGIIVNLAGDGILSVIRDLQF